MRSFATTIKQITRPNIFSRIFSNYFKIFTKNLTDNSWRYSFEGRWRSKSLLKIYSKSFRAIYIRMVVYFLFIALRLCRVVWSTTLMWVVQNIWMFAYKDFETLITASQQARHNRKGFLLFLFNQSPLCLIIYHYLFLIYHLFLGGVPEGVG